MEKLFDFLYYKVEQAPAVFGTLHIISLILLLTLSLLIVAFYKEKSDKGFRKILFAIWMLFVLGEIYREIYFSFDFVDGAAVFDYSWYQFPFQLCSSPLYALVPVIFLPEGKIRDGFLSFLAIFSFFGGAAVMLYPGNVFTKAIGISIQSMIHHGMQVILAIIIAKQYRNKYNLSFLRRGITVFLAFVFVAMMLNVSVYLVFLRLGIDETFNMFYISPFFDGVLPILSTIQEKTSGWLMFPLYTFSFLGLSYLIFFVQGRLLGIKSNILLKK